MAEKNRYLDLLTELNDDEKSIAELEPKPPKKAKSKARPSKKKPPTAKAKLDPKMPRVSKSGKAKSKNPDFEKGTYYLPKSTTYEMRIYATTKQLEMSDLVAEAVAEYLENHPL